MIEKGGKYMLTTFFSVPFARRGMKFRVVRCAERTLTVKWLERSSLMF